MTTIYYTGCTLDGFIATDDHSLDWLTSRDIDSDGPMGYPGFRERLGACVMGATTWQWLLDEVWLQYAPVMIGSGAPVLPRHVELRLEEIARNHDFMCGRFAVVR